MARVERAEHTQGLVLISAAAAALVVAARVADVGRVAWVETFVVIFVAIVVEALPFVLLGAVASAMIAVYVSPRRFAALARLPVAVQLPVAAMGGFAFPVCECGSVPVARRLITRGVHPAAGISFMLASPILNPIVLAATWIAYQPRGLGGEMTAARAALGLIVAVIAGWAIGGEGAGRLLRTGAADVDAAGVDDESDRAPRRGPARWVSLTDHVATDFVFMGKFLVLGAALSAALQTVVPQSLLDGIARTPLLGTLALMAVAFVSSLCSEADAFVAVSFTQFPLGSQLGFLTLGPVLDLKLAFLYGGIFRRRFVPALAAVVVPLTLAGSLVFERILG